MGEEREQTAVFVVRMWLEPGGGAAPRWRGSVDRVGTSARMYFSNLGAMCEFMLLERERCKPPLPE